MSDVDLKINQLAAEGMPDRKAELTQLFPEAMTDGKIDVEKLKLLLGEAVEESPERYGLNWPGKREAMRLAQKQSTATLEPMEDESVDWDTTKNVIIEGDNLEVLKLLQKSYYGQVKLIYIDPPYNTGHKFTYPDKYEKPLEGYLQETGQLQGGIRTRLNSDTNGRFHSDWLDLMYPRLVVAHSLLKADGVIFVSIDDDEVHNLRHLLDEIFGRENFYGNIVWEKKYSPANDAKRLSDVHDHILVYQKSDAFKRNLLPRTAENNAPYKHDDGDGRGPYRTDNLSVRTYSTTYDYPLQNPHTGKRFTPPQGRAWTTGPETMQSWISENRIYWGRDGEGAPQLKRYLSEVQQGTVPTTLWRHSDVGHNDESRKEIKALFGTTSVFDTPKPTRLLRQIIRISTNPEDLVIDFFAGSGTTADAVLQENAEDGGSRQFVLVQAAEKLGREGYATIADITRERVRRAGKKVAEAAGLSTQDLDTGFRAYKLAASNFKNWDADADSLLADDLEAFVDNINTGASDAGIVHEIMLKAGLRLDTDLRTVEIAGAAVTLAEKGAVAVSANKEITQDFIDGLLALEPQVQQVFLLDTGFGDNDSLKVNARHQFAARRSDSDPDKNDALRTV